jgi:ribonuclease P protein component
MKRSDIMRRKADIDMVFTTGRRINSFPLVMLVTDNAEISGDTLVLFSVPKRRFKKAVDRNRIRRQMREAWRLNRHQLPKGPSMHIALVYTGSAMPDYKDLQAKIIVLLGRLHVPHEETTG